MRSRTKLETNQRCRAVFANGDRFTKANGNGKYDRCIRIRGYEANGILCERVTFCQTESGAEKATTQFVRKHGLTRSTLSVETVGTDYNVWVPVGDGLDRFLYIHRLPTAEMSEAWAKEFSQKHRYLIVDETAYRFYIYILGAEVVVSKETYEIIPYEGMGGPVFIGKQTL